MPGVKANGVELFYDGLGDAHRWRCSSWGWGRR